MCEGHTRRAHAHVTPQQRGLATAYEVYKRNERHKSSIFARRTFWRARKKFAEARAASLGIEAGGRGLLDVGGGSRVKLSAVRRLGFDGTLNLNTNDRQKEVEFCVVILAYSASVLQVEKRCFQREASRFFENFSKNILNLHFSAGKMFREEIS